MFRHEAKDRDVLLNAEHDYHTVNIAIAAAITSIVPCTLAKQYRSFATEGGSWWTHATHTLASLPKVEAGWAASLANLSKSFKVLNKGVFPYSFVTMERLEYFGSFPDYKYFSISKSDYELYLTQFQNKS